MRTTTLQCDRCGKVVDDLDELTVAVTGRFTRTAWTHLTAEWCEDCLVTTGLRKKASTEPAPEPLTIEQLVREIAREEAEAVVALGEPVVSAPDVRLTPAQERDLLERATEDKVIRGFCIVVGILKELPDDEARHRVIAALAVILGGRVVNP